MSLQYASDQEIIDKATAIESIIHEKSSNGFAATHDRMKRLRESTQEYIAAVMEEPFGSMLAEMPQETIEDRRALCRAANATLREIGLAVLCPKTGDPTTLHMGQRPNPAVGSFLLISHAGDRKRTTRSSVKLFPMKLTAYPERREPLAEYWASRVQGGRGNSSGLPDRD